MLSSMIQPTSFTGPAAGQWLYTQALFIEDGTQVMGESMFSTRMYETNPLCFTVSSFETNHITSSRDFVL